MAISVPIDMRDITTTPVFKHVTVEDIPASEREGKAMMKTVEAVEVRFAGSKLYSPVFPASAQWKREGNKMITYAERWADQYRDFIAGNNQKADGTPLELLKPYGISDSHLSLCRVLKVYSIESLDALEGSNLKSLGMASNDLKKMARDYLADRFKGEDSRDEIAKLRAEIEALRAANVVPVVEATKVEIDEALKASDDQYAGISDAELKDFIAAYNDGKKPAGNPSRGTLISMLDELKGAA